MNFNDKINIGDDLIVKSYYTKDKDGPSINFNTKCVEIVKDNIILVDEIRSQTNEPVNFQSDIVSSDLYRVKIGKIPINWENVVIKRIRNNDIFVNVIGSRNNGKKFNRRKDYRVYVGYTGIGRLGLSRKTSNVIVKDVSKSGFSFSVYNESNIVNIRDEIRITFDDPNMGNRIVLNGICVRKQITSEDKTLYGCIFFKKDKEISEYIIKKQQEELKKATQINS